MERKSYDFPPELFRTREAIGTETAEMGLSMVGDVVDAGSHAAFFQKFHKSVPSVWSDADDE